MADTAVLNLKQDDLQQISESFESASPQQILRWAAEQFGDQLAVVTSFQPTGIVTLHMLADIAPNTPVLTLDTGLLFQETYDLIEDMEQRFNLNLKRVTPELTVDEQATAHGDKLWQRDPNLCCHMRKTLPLRNALNGYAAWITGLRRDQSARRANTPIVQWDENYQIVKLCPFANWTEDMLWTYIHAYDLPYNELHNQGYPSIGCFHCTQPVLNGADPRSGRWVSHKKSECGIHVPQAEANGG